MTLHGFTVIAVIGLGLIAKSVVAAPETVADFDLSPQASVTATWAVSPEPRTKSLGTEIRQYLAQGKDDLLLGPDPMKKGGGDLLLDQTPVKKAPAKPAMPEKKAATDAAKQHAALFTESRFPSATTCGTCHPRHFEEWAVSQHSYAQLSPAYMALQNFINLQVNGTNGDFCIRCHNQVGMAQGEATGISNLKRQATSREGITCVVCHRVQHAYNKASGRIAVVEGDLLQPVYGPSGNAELKRVLKNPQQYRVVTDPKKAGRKIHTDSIKFAPISSSTFCGTCHDVTLLNGFRLEEAFSEYRTSPAAARGETCQDCHMGKIQGKVSGYARGPAAEVGGVPTKSRKLTNHMFAGPDYSLVHPGIFPHNAEAQQLAKMEQWLEFDYIAGWGTKKFEDTVTASTKFPKSWKSVDDRYDAREILNVQFKRLALIREKRLEVLRNGYAIGDIVTEKQGKSGIEFKVQVKNLTDGHNVPTGFTGERLVWLRVTVTDATGKVVFISGDDDPNGDVRDNESSYVHAGELPLDKYLFSLQSRFLVQSVRGGERERTVTIPYSTTSLPFLRPTRLSLILTGESTIERNHRKGIEALGHRWAPYEIDGDALTGKGPYRAKVELLAQMFPINLITTIQVVGFDYGLSPRAVADAVVAGREVLVEKTLTFDVK
ncbi:MAG: cytochrome c553 [Kiritimatiellia bacterium]|jgi:cytochrome c553